MTLGQSLLGVSPDGDKRDAPEDATSTSWDFSFQGFCFSKTMTRGHTVLWLWPHVVLTPCLGGQGKQELWRVAVASFQPPSQVSILPVDTVLHQTPDPSQL